MKDLGVHKIPVPISSLVWDAPENGHSIGVYKVQCLIEKKHRQKSVHPCLKCD